jgi:hypothetical protein
MLVVLLSKQVKESTAVLLEAIVAGAVLPMKVHAGKVRL